MTNFHSCQIPDQLLLNQLDLLMTLMAISVNFEQKKNDGPKKIDLKGHRGIEHSNCSISYTFTPKRCLVNSLIN